MTFTYTCLPIIHEKGYGFDVHYDYHETYDFDVFSKQKKTIIRMIDDFKTFVIRQLIM